MKKILKKKGARKQNEALKLINTKDAVTPIKPSNLGFLSPTIKAVNEVSASLSLGINNKPLLSSYDNLVSSQRSILASIGNLNTGLALNANQVNAVSASIISPLSSAVANVGVLAASVNQNYALGAISQDFLKSAQSIAGTSIYAIKEQQQMVLRGLGGISRKEDLNRLAVDTAPALSLVSTGINTLTHSVPAFPDFTRLPPSVKEINKTVADRTKVVTHQEKLDGILSSINEELVNFRKGCWVTFRKKGDDYIGQAASSMRRLVDALLRAIAPNREVQKTEFFQKNPEARDDKGRPSKKAKIYYVLGYDKNRTERFKRLADSLLKAHENLSAWDHNPTKEDNFVEGVFITVEGCLLSLLSEWKRGD